MNVVVSAAAQADLARLHAFLWEKNPAAGRQALAALDAAIQSLSVFPNRGLASEIPGLRELIVPFGASAYVLRYAVFAARDEIAVVRIWHGREKRER